VSKEKCIVFLKAPRPGEVKTRLAIALGATAACDAYRRLVAETLAGVQSIPAVELRFSPDDAREEIVPWLRRDWTACPQGAGDLGARLQRAFAGAFATGAERVVIIGSDAPEVSAADIRSAWRELRSHDIVVGPATDGGYWLIGLNAPRATLFENIPWSTDQVLAHTLRRARQMQLRIQLLRILADVDTGEDWRDFMERRGGTVR
jgi:rSAM/selenodomain-associated transferase 1